MHPYSATYRLHSGQCGRLHILAACSFDALLAAMDALGDAPARLSVMRA